MKTFNFTGISETAAEKISTQLNDLLANYQVLYTNVRGFHWNIEGEHFFTLHAKFEELYDSLAEKIDELAERILMLNGKPENSFSSYLKVAEIKEVCGVSCGETAIKSILDGLAIILKKQRALLSVAADNKDEATMSLLTDCIVEQEKTIWMYTASLKGSCDNGSCSK